MSEDLTRLETEAENPRSRDLDRLDSASLAALVFEEDRAAQVACAAASADVARLIDGAADALAVGGRLVYAGAGTSGRLALQDAVELLPTFGLASERVPVLLAGGREAVFRAREGAEDREEDGVRAAQEIAVGPLDFVVGVSASGRTPFTLGVLRAARRRGARTGAVVCAAVGADFPAEIVACLATGPEVLAGSTRMKAGSATKMALNCLSLGAMVRLGKVHGNRMVDVRIGSRKLLERALRLVHELGGVERPEAERLLAAADGNAKTAILMARAGIDAAEAVRRLTAAQGVLRAALGDGTR